MRLPSMTTPEPVTSLGACLVQGLKGSGYRRVENTLTTAFSTFTGTAGAGSCAAVAYDIGARASVPRSARSKAVETRRRAVRDASDVIARVDLVVELREWVAILAQIVCSQCCSEPYGRSPPVSSPWPLRRKPGDWRRGRLRASHGSRCPRWPGRKPPARWLNAAGRPGRRLRRSR